MWKAIVQPVKAAFPIMIGIITTCFAMPALSQQNIIANKDNTRPETSRQNRERAESNTTINAVSLARYNGYNELSWNAVPDATLKGFTLEYSIDGIDYQVAGVAINVNGIYTAKHYTNENRPLFYRIRNDRSDGRFTYSAVKVTDGTEDAPVKLQSTTIRGNVINAVAERAVQRINVYSGTGTQVYARDVSGQKDFISTTLPSLSKGIYYMTFYGDGWKNTQKFIVL